MKQKRADEEHCSLLGLLFYDAVVRDRRMDVCTSLWCWRRLAIPFMGLEGLSTWNNDQLKRPKAS